MDEQSLWSNGTMKIFLGEAFDAKISSSSSQTQHQLPVNHPTTSKFKGAVSLPNGRWGSQIYVNGRRIWLGSFKSKSEAAMAYDSAAIKIYVDGHSQQRNFPPTNVTVHESKFQSQFSHEAILAMIKDESYIARFYDFMRSQEQQDHVEQFSGGLESSPLWFRMKITFLFQKELKPSDVGKLDRLVIPKKYALIYLPALSDDKKYGKDTSYNMDLMIYDRLMKPWRVNYGYMRSSQSFVFTQGWIAFAKENRLRACDRVIFSSSEHDNQKIYIIEAAYHDGEITNGEGGHEATLGFDRSGNDDSAVVPVPEPHPPSAPTEDDSAVVEVLSMPVPVACACACTGGLCLCLCL